MKLSLIIAAKRTIAGKLGRKSNPLETNGLAYQNFRDNIIQREIIFIALISFMNFGYNLSFGTIKYKAEFFHLRFMD